MQDNRTTRAACPNLYFMRAALMGYPHINFRMFGLDGCAQGESLFLFAMHNEHGAGQWVNGSYVGQEVVPVGMSRQAVEFHDLRPPLGRHTEDGDHIPPFDQLAAQCMFCLKADKDDDVRFLLNGVFEMVDDAAALAHAGRGDDDTGSAHAIEALTVFRRGDEVDIP